jgi:hypothetical protein
MQLRLKILRRMSAVADEMAGHLLRIQENLKRRIGLAEFVPREDDIFIVTYPRSGTTWMQMILYQLTTDGKMDFTHIGHIMPHFENALGRRDLNDLPSPRIIKTHMIYKALPKKKGKFIYIARNGKDVLVSNFHFYKSSFGHEESFDLFVNNFLHNGSPWPWTWFEHVAEWKKHAADPNVLFLNYEDLIADLEGGIKKIAAFCGIDVPPEKYPVILERCSFAFMKQHESKFDPINEQEPPPLGEFLRHGKVGAGERVLDADQEMRFDRLSMEYFGELRGVPREGELKRHALTSD